MNPGTNAIDDGSPPWLHPVMSLSDQKMIAAVILVLAVIGLLGVVVYGVRQRLHEAERRRRKIL